MLFLIHMELIGWLVLKLVECDAIVGERESA